jgi:TPR repeat protein
LAEIYGYFDDKFDNIYTENVYKCMKEKNMPNYDIAFMWLNNIVKKVNGDDPNVDKDLLPQAKYRLGMMYENGFGVPKNLTEAKKLYSQAAKQGNKEAAEALKKNKKIKK